MKAKILATRLSKQWLKLWRYLLIKNALIAICVCLNAQMMQFIWALRYLKLTQINALNVLVITINQRASACAQLTV